MNTALAEWKFGEQTAVSGTTPFPGAIELRLSPGLTERRIYLYASAARSTLSDWFRLDLQVELLRDGTPVAVIPATVANHSGNQPSKSTITAFLAGGSPVEDSIQITIANPLNVDPKSAILQPMKLSCEVDQIRLNMVSYSGPSVGGWRAFLAVLSTRD
jgi:hypothetical protein